MIIFALKATESGANSTHSIPICIVSSVRGQKGGVAQGNRLRLALATREGGRVAGSLFMSDCPHATTRVLKIALIHLASVVLAIGCADYVPVPTVWFWPLTVNGGTRPSI